MDIIAQVEQVCLCANTWLQKFCPSSLKEVKRAYLLPLLVDKAVTAGGGCVLIMALEVVVMDKEVVMMSLKVVLCVL